MTCGRDAADKGGGNRQDGCGQGFRWNDAPPYRHAPPALPSDGVVHVLCNGVIVVRDSKLQTAARTCRPVRGGDVRPNVLY